MKNALTELGLTPVKVELGEVETLEKLSDYDKKRLNEIIKKAGLEVLVKKQDIIVEKIKHVIIDHIYSPEGQPNIKFSDLLSRQLHYNYGYLSNLFFESENFTITQYMIRIKIERIKELIMLEDLTLTEIAFKLHYSSCAHLSSQFKKITGFPPSQFQKLSYRNRATLQEM